jgi:hypothetical protein
MDALLANDAAEIAWPLIGAGGMERCGKLNRLSRPLDFLAQS